MSYIQIEKIEKAFRGRPALHPLTLEIERGEIFGLLGHNGAGKSTTFGIMLGHVHPDSGEVRIGGHAVATDRTNALEKTGAIFESPSFYDYLSGNANLDYLLSLTGPVSDARRAEVIELVGLSDRMHHRVGTYSHGMRQRLALAQALLPNPEFILLDEPNDGLDPQGIIETRELIQRLRSEHGITIMFSSHILSEVEHLCDRIAILHQGHLVFCGRWQDAIADTLRIRLRFQHPDLAQPMLQQFGVTFLAEDTYEFPGNTDLGALSGALAATGSGILEFGIKEHSLEEFYLSRVAKESA